MEGTGVSWGFATISKCEIANYEIKEV